MEESRLKPMQKGYDENLFNQLYDSTKILRKKLASQIDCQRFGVDYKEVLSWFDIKFIYVFNKYYHQKEPQILKAYIINSLQFYKNRILRKSYSFRNQVNNHNLPLEEITNCKEVCFEVDFPEKEIYLETALRYMKENLTPEAYLILQIELNPPLYILKKLKEKETTTKIPSKLIAEYLGYPTHSQGIKQINKLRREIKNIINSAHEYFTLSHHKQNGSPMLLH